MMLSITPIYAAILTFLFIFLSVRTLKQRRTAQVALGTGDTTIDENKELLRRVRVHANCAEYAPLALVMAAFVEMQAVSQLLVHGICLCLLIGRMSHAWGVSQHQENFTFRVAGMGLTFASMSISALSILVIQVLHSNTIFP